MPDAELKRMEEQATRFLESLRREIPERSKMIFEAKAVSEAKP
jgi:hypothetical protein